MKSVQRALVFALAVLLVGIPVVTFAQTSGGASGAAGAAGASGGATSSPGSTSGGTGAGVTGGASTSTPAGSSSTGAGVNTGGSASPGSHPVLSSDCTNNGWQKFGLKSEAECLSSLGGATGTKK